eukprot:NP_741839.2 Uncharacterized protein CELE_F48E3.8 [Caenorhabditis elegans]
MLQNEIMADHRTINQSFRGNFFRRRNYDGPRAYQIAPDLTCSYDNQCAGYPLAICHSVCQCVKGALNTGTTCIASSTAIQTSVACPAGQTYIREAGVCMTVQQPGEPCQYSQQCSALEPGAYCLKMRCECVYGMKKSSNGCTFVNNDCKERGHIFISEIGECREVFPPGGKGCSHNLQCSGAYPDATCFMQTCTCPPNLPVAADGTCGRSCPNNQVYSGVTGECLPEKQPGQDCIYSSQCQASFGGLVCDKNTCRCPNGLVFDGLKCSHGCPPHKRVIDKEICVEGCPSGIVEVAGRCVKQVSIGQPCVANAQCNFGSFCQSGTCQCPPGFYVQDEQCQAIESEPNESCQNNEKCTKGSVCYNGKCSCPRNHELINGHCQQNRAAAHAYNTALENIRKIRLRFASQSKSRNSSPQLTDVENDNDTVPIGSACVRIGVTCDGGSVCVAGICVCPLGKTPRNGVCIEHVAARPGTSCQNEEECVDHSYCSPETNKCECMKASQMVIGGECRERLKAHPGYGCTMGEMCVGNSVCVNGKCACVDGKVEINKICIDQVSAKPGDTCGKGIICEGGSYCNTDSGKCACRRGENSINGICKGFTFVYPGDLCTDITSRCTGGSYCARGRCECPPRMSAIDKKCVHQQTAAPGEPCSEKVACSPFSVCENNVCKCVNNMMIRDKMCVQRRKVNIGNSCNNEDQCLGNSTCMDNNCQCGIGFVASMDVCVLRKTGKPNFLTPGYLCNPEDICTGQSVCIKGVCQCQPDYKQMHNICVKKNIGIEGSPCSSRDDCGEGLMCGASGKCSCPEGLFSVNGKCRSYVQLGQTCTSDDRCAERNAQCQENYCTCRTGYTNINGQCAANIVTPAEPETLSQVKSTKCLASNQCPSGAQCVKGECRCKPGLGITRYGFCVPITFAEPGTSCAYGEHCQKDSHCEDGLCTCNEPLVLKENKCVVSPREQTRRRQPSRLLTECPRDGSCRLPSCFCTSTGKIPPNNFDTKQVPQMVMLSFDDPITDRIINTLKSLFSGSIRNPNGCAIKGTFFVSHQWNNYDQSLWLHSTNHEIGVNSITREDLSGRTQERWYKEQKGMRETLAEFSFIDRSHIIGTRAPELKIGGDAQYRMMSENNFTFDNSMLVSSPYWPQTLDHKLAWECDGNCPTQSHKAIWEIPIQNIQANDTRWYKTLTRAMKPFDSRDSVTKMLQRNFMNHYKTNRAPFILTLDTEFLTYLPDNGAVYALRDFLKFIVQKQDVFVVTGSQIIDYMRNPVDLNNIKSLRSWQCKPQMKDEANPCENPTTCSFSGRARGQFAHSFRMCGVCPKSYPWI